MEDCSEEDTNSSDIPFTFPQVKPLYASIRKGHRFTKKPLKPLKCIFMHANEEMVQVENQAKIEAPEDDSFSVNSLSGDLKPFCKTESSEDLRRNRKEANTNDKFVTSTNNKSNVDLITPYHMRFATPFSAKGSASLIKRVPKNCFTPGLNVNEENGFHHTKETKFSQHPTDKMLNENHTKSNGRQDGLCSENVSKSSKGGRILKDILNYDQNIQAKKSVDAAKLTKDSKLINADNNHKFRMPSITYQKETSVSGTSRKSPKATDKMTPAVMNKNIRSCTTKTQNRRGNVELPERVKHQQMLFKETEDEKQNIMRCNPSVPNRIEPAVLSVNNTQYSVLSKLGQGGSSQVFQVLDNETSSLLAIKCVNLGETDEVTATGYLKEIEMLLKLQSSNRVIKLIDHEYFKQKQILYVIMEKGDTDLSTLLKQMAKSGDVSLPMIIYYWTEMLYAVEEIHSHGIVHADLKPANFLLVCGRLKLIDFGIASAIQTDATSIFKNSMHGTCNYMSPEAIQDPGDSSRTKVGYKSDVWSLGCILYNLLYRKTPFQHITNNLKKLQIISNPNHKIEFPAVEKCPPPLMTALKRCLTYDAKKRPTVTELLAENYIWPTDK